MNHIYMPDRVCWNIFRSACLTLSLLLHVLPATASPADYDNLVLKARAGDTAPLLHWLGQNRSRLGSD
ncbi:hypothetical protein BN1049_01461 [Pseudomonas saudimassiliensis]|uniref:Uncharacterized protein n=1 Tax=Pseudomonas saudimassiliensis TaxID=1461581 RepID=A0A078MA94_9PSED|nr:hypothetical protein BN1049_01461 [Pseudomonas saudimassiliensis]CEF26528.1 hypothetical protein BN1049_01461 [Pseudomonas saudimassiliensis]